MKTRLSPFLIGSFVLGGLILLVVGLLSIRSLHLFSKPARFVAYFNESVHGLDVGSSVKLRGVRVGRVVTIRVYYDANTRQSKVAVNGELENSAVSDRSGQRIQITDSATFQRLIDQGLRAKVDLVGITGLQFVELDFFDPQEFPAPHRDGESQLPVVPTLGSGMSELTTTLSKIASNLNKFDFAGLSSGLQVLLDSMNRQMRDVNLKLMVTEVTAAAQSIEALAGSKEAKVAFKNLNETATGVHGLVAKLDAQVEPVQMELLRTLRSFHDAAEGIHKLFGPQSGLDVEAIRTLQQVRETAESLQQFAEFLERNPNALITGRKMPETKP